MNYSKNQGSALVVIIIIISVAIVGLLGYVVWNNFLKTDSTSNNQSSEPAKNDNEPTFKLDQSYTLPGENLTFDYPKSWTATTNYKVNDYGNDNTLELTNKAGAKVSIQIPGYGPPWQFGERSFSCPFDQGYVEGSSFTLPELCPSFKELSSAPVKAVSGISVYAFLVTYPEGSSATNRLDFVVAKDGCKGTDAALCSRPTTKTGYYLSADSTISTGSLTDYINSEEAKEIMAILASAHY